MYKLSTFLANPVGVAAELGPAGIPLFGPNDSYFEKTASAQLLPEVLTYIAQLKPRPGSQYVLVGALGAGEYWGSNVNGDHFEEDGLLHLPTNWTNNPLVDRALGKDWTYGFPTFYAAHPFSHHKNQDPGRAYGVVELACWHHNMRRVELVCRVDQDKCEQFGGMAVWDKLRAGQFPDVSMGSRVCYDLSSITTDWGLYREALATFDPKKHKYPGLAVVEFHKNLQARGKPGIRGLAITRRDYDEYTSSRMNYIFPDGRKVFVYNPYPRFFDISFVYVGADRSAKTMVLIVRAGGTNYVPSAVAGEKMSTVVDHEGSPVELEKAASDRAAHLAEELLKHALGVKNAVDKSGEISKSIPAQSAVPLLEQSDPDIPPHLMDALCGVPIEKSLSTTASMGVVLKPEEFQRILLVRLGKADMANELAAAGKVFPAVEERQDVKLSPDSFSAALASLLLPLLAVRSALAPYVETRVSLAVPREKKTSTSHSSELLRKIGAAYNGYRHSLMSMAATAQDLLPTAAPSDESVRKLASASPESVFTDTTHAYLSGAFLPAVCESVDSSAASVRGAMPPRNT